MPRAIPTLYLDYAATIPSGIKAYSGTLDQNSATLTLNKIDGNVIPANTAVLVEASATGKYTFSEADGGAKAVAGNSLDGVPVDTPVENIKKYNSGKAVLTLGLLNGEIGFRQPAGENISANRAYLLVDESSAAKSFSISFGGETTDINEVRTDEADAPVYNLSGQRVANGKKGLLIKNGRKYVCK